MLRFFHFRSDIPFSKDDTNRFLPWIIAFIVFITGMMIAFGMGLYSVASQNHSAQTNGITIEIPATNNNATQLAETIVDMLRKETGVKDASVLNTGDMQALIKPWLGTDVALGALPLPRVIDVSFTKKRLDLDALRKKISSIAADVKIDDHAQWISQYTSMLGTMQWSLWIAALLFIITTLAIVILTTRASIKIHRRVIQILHTIGALDSYIAKQFQYNAFFVAAQGALIGSVVALLFYILMCVFTSKLSLPLLPTFQFGIGQAALFLFLPLIVGMGALIASRLTVLAELRRMP